MKHASHFFPVALVALMALVASSSGVAEEQGRDRTGAPGSDPVCTSCHNNGTASISASFEILDWNTEEAVTEYLPGQDYLVRMVVAGGDAGLNYGVQATAVLGDESNAGTFTAVSSNAQLEDVGGRHIVEHSAPSAANVFDATWTAPGAGSGTADFYMSALAVNGNGATSGDTYAAGTLSLPEATGDGLGTSLDFAWGRPVQSLPGTWNWTAPVAGRLVVTDLAGRVLRAETLASQQTSSWTATGVNVVSFVSRDGARQSWKVAAR